MIPLKKKNRPLLIAVSSILFYTLGSVLIDVIGSMITSYANLKVAAIQTQINHLSSLSNDSSEPVNAVGFQMNEDYYEEQE